MLSANRQQPVPDQFRGIYSNCFSNISRSLLISGINLTRFEDCFLHVNHSFGYRLPPARINSGRTDFRRKSLIEGEKSGIVQIIRVVWKKDSAWKYLQLLY